MEQKKRIISKFEVFLLVLAVALIGYMVLRNKGIHLAKQTEEVEIVDKPNTKKKYVPKQRRTEEIERERAIEEMLRKLGDESSQKPQSLYNTTESRQPDADERRYNKKIAGKYAQSEKKEPSDLLPLLQASKKTYFSVRKLFADADKSEAELFLDDVQTLLKNEQLAKGVFRQLEAEYGIPAEKSADFAQKGKKALSDWATFVEEQRPKDEQ